ncbi:alpha/beta hydrolase [Proteiniclasticum sp.]|uniref:alpha/beta fold hydrolase n=1 Tax=Proteiniclasticum sp. TaxID=2053595 RepID=UPI00289ED10F|nr:alpha/beta hydrolase [Proteiniclasticum sp.]
MGGYFYVFFDINGTKIFYEIRGNQNAEETIVFLNGVMASTNSWYALSKPFEDLGFRVLLHDFKGQLKSDKPDGPYTFQEHADELKMLLEELRIENAHFIGTSYGGEVAMKFASLYGSTMRTMTIIDSTSELDPVMKYFISSWKKAAQEGDGEKFFNILAPSIYGEKFMRENAEFLEARAKATKHVGQEYLDGQIILYDTFINDVNMTDILEDIRVKTLVICGEEDILKRPKQSLLIHHKIRNSEYVILPECGHVSIFEKPEELKTLLLGFILKNRGPAA